MCVKGKETEWTLSSLVKKIKPHSCSTEIHTKTSFCLLEGKNPGLLVNGGGSCCARSTTCVHKRNVPAENWADSLAVLPTIAIPEMPTFEGNWIFSNKQKNGWHCIQWFRILRCTRQDFLVQLVPQRMNRNSFGTFLWPPNQKAWLCIANWNYHHKKIKVVVLV